MKVSLLVLFVIAAIVEGLDVRGHGNLDEPIKGDVRILSPRFLRLSELGFAVLDLSRQAMSPPASRAPRRVDHSISVSFPGGTGLGPEGLPSMESTI
jgi:hypothetical protein